MGTKWDQCAATGCTNNRISPAALCNACLAEVYGQVEKPPRLVQPVGNLEDQDLPPLPKPKSEEHTPRERPPGVGPGSYTETLQRGTLHQQGMEFLREAYTGAQREPRRPIVPVPTPFKLRPTVIGECESLLCEAGNSEAFWIHRLRIVADKPVLMCGASVRGIPKLPFHSYSGAVVGVLTDSYAVPGGVHVDFGMVCDMYQQKLDLLLSNPHDDEISGIVELWGFPGSIDDVRRMEPQTWDEFGRPR